MLEQPLPGLSATQKNYLSLRGEGIRESRLRPYWFTKPARGLDYRPPCIVIANDDGYPQVNDYISRIEYGVYC